MTGNRITDISLADLAASISTEVTVLQLSKNKITVIDKKILEMIIEPNYKLQVLGLANNLLRQNSADAIFRNARYSRHIKRLDLRSNKLGVNCLDSLIELIEKTTTLEELYIGTNYLSGYNCGQRIFTALTYNKTLQVFDYSLNQLGEVSGLGVAQSIAKCLEINRNLLHLDVSFNNFNKEASSAISIGL